MIIRSSYTGLGFCVLYAYCRRIKRKIRDQYNWLQIVKCDTPKTRWLCSKGLKPDDKLRSNQSSHSRLANAGLHSSIFIDLLESYSALIRCDTQYSTCAKSHWRKSRGNKRVCREKDLSNKSSELRVKSGDVMDDIKCLVRQNHVDQNRDVYDEA